MDNLTKQFGAVRAVDGLSFTVQSGCTIGAPWAHRMDTLLRSEHRKFVSTRLWWILLLAMSGYVAFIAAVL